MVRARLPSGGGRAGAGDLPRAREHATSCGTPRPSRRSRRRALSLLLVHALVAVHLAHWSLAGRTLSPLEPSEAGETLLHGAVNAGFLFFLLLLVSTLVLGRFFCGWACHVVAYQDACAWLLGRLGLRPRPVRSRALALVPLLAAFLMFALPPLLRLAGGEGLPALAWHLSTDSFWERFPGPWIALLTFGVCGFLVVWLLGAKGFCTYGCPYGALFGLVERRARGRIRVSDACEGCGHCTATCTSNVRVHEEVARFRMVVDPGCMKCMDCVDVCPKGALSYGLGPVAPPGARAASGARGDFTWPEELALAGVFLVGLYAFRDLYEAVPFLLAIALAVVAAVAALALARLLRGADVRLQHVALKRAGRPTAAGVAALVVLPGFLALTGHSALVQVDVREGERRLAQAAHLPPGSAERRAALDASALRLGRALRRGLVETVGLRSRLGQIELHRGRSEAARAHLARVLELAPRTSSAHLYLAELDLAAGDVPAALARAERLLELAPDDPFLPALLAKLQRRAPAPARALVQRLEASRQAPGAR